MHLFRAAVEAGDMDAVTALLSDDMVFRSPVISEPLQGREVVTPVLRAVSNVLEDVRYVRELASEDGADSALLFQARIGDKQLEGTNFIHTNDQGLIDELVVMVRPLTGMLAMKAGIMTQLAAAGVPASAIFA